MILTIADVDDLLALARQAEGKLQYERSEAIVRRVLKLEPSNVAAATTLCSVLRALDRPTEAIKATNTVKDMEYDEKSVKKPDIPAAMEVTSKL